MKKELKELIEQEEDLIGRLYKHHQYCWYMANEITQDRYDLGQVDALEKELKFIEKLKDYIK